MVNIREDFAQWSIISLIKIKFQVEEWEYFKQRISWRNTPTNYLKIQGKESILIFHRQYFSADMQLMICYIQLISKFNKRIHLLLYVIDIFSKYARVILLKDTEGITITNAFKKI